MNIQIISVPYDSGHKGTRTGQGPEHFLHKGVDQILRELGHQVRTFQINSSDSLTTEIGTTFTLNRLLAEKINSAVSNKMFPIVLAGNCNSCVGTIAGIGQSQLGIIWLDAHGDFNTPETTITGFLDGMGLAMAAGRCWKSILKTIPGFTPVNESNIIHIGSRSLDIEEERQLKQSQIEIITPHEKESDTLKEVAAALKKLKNRVERIYLHVDIDVLDTGDALPSYLAVPGGLTVDVIEEIIKMIKEKFEISAGSITSFDPAYDKDDRVLYAGIRIIKSMVSAN